MKRIIIATIISLFAISDFSAQCKYGPRISAGLSSLGGGNSAIGVQAGIFINAELKDRCGVQGEVLYSMFTGNTTSTFTDATGAKVTYKTKYNFSYVNIPVYGYVPLSKHITFLLGPQFGVVNKGSERLTGPGISSDSSQTQDIPDTKTKLGIAAGIDFNMQSPLRFGIRYSSNGGDAFKGKASFVGATMAYYMDW
jgi:hypothetical protein